MNLLGQDGWELLTTYSNPRSGGKLMSVFRRLVGPTPYTEEHPREAR